MSATDRLPPAEQRREPPLRLVAEMTVRDLLRRRGAVALLVVMPFVFYLVRRDSLGQSIRGLLFGISWAISTVAFFAGRAAAELEPRLQLAGWRRPTLILGRLAGLLSVGAVLAMACTLLVAVDRDLRSFGVIALDFVVTTSVAVAVGTALAAFLTRELDGALAIFLLAGLQAVVNPFDAVAKFLPFWSSRELGTVGVDGAEAASSAGGLVHAAAVVAMCAVVAFAWRPRRH